MVSIRYIVNDVDAAVPFYTEHLGFALVRRPGPGFAILSRDGLRLLLNQPGAGGAGRVTTEGETPVPGGWNRIQIPVEELDATVARLKAAGCRFRGEVVAGQGGRQVLVEDPSGNPVELFQGG